MKEREVRIVDLPPMRVASALGFGTDPEDQAFSILVPFAKRIGLEPGSPGYRTFGFDNPGPSLGSPNYGYEVWLPVGPDVEAEDPITIKDVPQSKYAVTRVTGVSNIGRGWGDLVAWFEDSPYTRPPDCGMCLEEVLNPTETDPEKLIFDLYLSIAV